MQYLVVIFHIISVTVSSRFKDLSFVSPRPFAAAMNRANNQGRGQSFRAGGRGRSLPVLAIAEWDPIFETHRDDVNYNIENTPYVETRKEGESFIRTFMQDPDESDVCLPRADKIEAYCSGTSLECLISDDGEMSKDSQIPIVLLDDRPALWFYVEPEKSRRNQVPLQLSAREFYKALKNPV